jgi:predicted transcriptional regulator
MNDVRLTRIAKLKKESREITQQIIQFGVKEEQKIDIMMNLALTLENNTAMKEIIKTLKKFAQTINENDNEENNEETPKIIT